jgi:hypothetical protein
MQQRTRRDGRQPPTLQPKLGCIPGVLYREGCLHLRAHYARG